MGNNLNNMGDLIIQWNINSFRTQREQLMVLIQEDQPSIICLQETNFKKDFCGTLKHYNHFFKNRPDEAHASGGVATYVNKKLSSTEIHLDTNLEAVATTILVKSGYLTICNIYLPNSQQFNQQDIQNLISQLPPPFIIVGDFNSHSPTWGSEKLCPRGRIIDKILEETDIIIMNSGEATHFNNSYKTFSAIDLTLCSADIAHKIEWKTLEDPHGSDHTPIKLTIQNSKNQGNESSPKWKFDRADWDKFKQIIEDMLTEKEMSPPSELSIDEKMDSFVEIILEAAEQSIPKTSGKPWKYRTPWWNKECQEALKNSKRAFNRYKRHPSTFNECEYKRLRAITRKTFKESKRISWINFVSQLSRFAPMSEIWDKLKKIRGVHKSTQVKTLVSDDGEIHHEPLDIANILAKTFADNSSDKNYTPAFARTKTSEHPNEIDIDAPSSEINPELDEMFEKQEIKTLIKISRNSAAGPDGIFNIFLKNLPECGYAKLTTLFNEIWTAGSFPKSWQTAIVIPIPKPGKDHSKPCNYRPISLTSNLCKLMEKFVNRRLMWHLEKINFISPYQNGFQKRRSVYDHLVCMQQEICKAFISNNHLIAICLDMEKAYDMVWRDRIVSILKNSGINGKMLRFIQNFLTDRRMKVKINNITSEESSLQNGVPQGSVMSVTLFLVAINEITSLVPPPLRCFLYADDVTITCSGKNPNTTQELLQSTMDTINNWANNNGFKFSKNKSELIMFEKQHTDKQIQVKLDGTSIKRSTSVRILGLIFDEKMNWKQHLKVLKGECLKRMNIIKSISSTNWGADKTIIKNTYNAFIRSKIDYGSIVYSSACNTLLKTLEPIHNQSQRLAIGAFRTSPISSILAESGAAPLAYRREQLIISYSLKAIAEPRNPVSHLLLEKNNLDKYDRKPRAPKPLPCRLKKILDNIKLDIPLISQYKILPSPLELIKTPVLDLSLATNVKKNTSPEIYRAFFYELIQKYIDFVHIYTDGSKGRDGTGCAVIFPGETKFIKLHHTSSVYYGEAYAIKSTLDFIRNSSAQKFAIFTDSRSTLESIKTKNITTPISVEIISTYHELIQSGKQITLIWIPSHVNIPGNELADQAAKSATLLDDSESNNHPALHQDINKYAKKMIREKWNQEWKSATPSKLHSVRDSTYDLQPICDENRREQIIITRLRIGHSKLTHSHKMSKSEPDKCNFCDVPYTIPHLLSECQQSACTRRELGIPNDLKSSLNSEESIRKILQLLDKLQLYNKI